jgi:hypothetical protein
MLALRLGPIGQSGPAAVLTGYRSAMSSSGNNSPLGLPSLPFPQELLGNIDLPCLESADDLARHEHPTGLIDRVVHPFTEDLTIRAAQTSPQ